MQTHCIMEVVQNPSLVVRLASFDAGSATTASCLKTAMGSTMIDGDLGDPAKIVYVLTLLFADRLIEI